MKIVIGQNDEIQIVTETGNVLFDSTSETTPSSTKVPSTAPIGTTVDGVIITHYGYPGDSSPDSYSMAGIGDRGNHLVPNVSCALTLSARHHYFGTSGHSTGKGVVIDGKTYTDDDTAPEDNMRLDVYDPYYQGVDKGCTGVMYAHSKAEMTNAGIL